MNSRFYVVIARDQVEDYLQQALGIARYTVTPEKDIGLIRGLISNALNNLLRQEQFEGNMNQDLTLIPREELKAIAHRLGAEEGQTRGKSVRELQALVESLTHTPSGATAPPSVSKLTCKREYVRIRPKCILPLQKNL
jgi:hypothetical protein